MPRKAIDYQKVIIYKLVCNDLSVKDLYVGHTTDFTNIKKRHKGCSINSNYNGYNCKVYKMIRNNGGWDNWSMVEIEKYPCNNKNEACSRERYWYEVLNANMNSLCPTLDLKKKKETHKIHSKNYYEKNKDNIKVFYKDYYVQNKDTIKERTKLYRDNNKDKIKDYYVQNKDKINEKHKVYREQIKTKKHLKYIQEIESN